MVPMGPLQPGLPSPVAIPKGYYKIVIDLKDCSFTIPLHPKDCERFAFSVPSVNFKEPMKRYHWTVLPQGMANSPTLCQRFVAKAIQPVRQQWPNIYIIHFTDDVLMAGKDPQDLLLCYGDLRKALADKGLQIASEKIQTQDRSKLPHLKHTFFPRFLENIACAWVPCKVSQEGPMSAQRRTYPAKSVVPLCG